MSLGVTGLRPSWNDTAGMDTEEQKEKAMIDFEKLKAPFPVTQVSWRVGNRSPDNKTGLPLAYLDARDIMQRLDDVCGPAGWQCRYSHADMSKTICEIGIIVDGIGEYQNLNPQWIWKSNGAGDTAVEADKGAISDAFKRAGVMWGIGRYLYDIKAPYVSIYGSGNHWSIADHEMERLYALLPTPDGTPAKGITVHSPTGLSKTPAKFWDGKDLNVFVKLPKIHKDAHGDPNWSDPETISAIFDVINSAIEKAPNQLCLKQLQVDNLSWIVNRLDGETAKGVIEAFRIRASQFDHQEKQDGGKK